MLFAEMLDAMTQRERQAQQPACPERSVLMRRCRRGYPISAAKHPMKTHESDASALQLLRGGHTDPRSYSPWLPGFSGKSGLTMNMLEHY
jgi:hypothetical protein